MRNLLLPLLFLLAFTKLHAQKPAGIIAFWNVENFFDTINDPAKDDDEFTPNGKDKWTSDRYITKRDHLAKVIGSMDDGRGPVILGMSEVENENVLVDLTTNTPLKKKKYGIVHYESPDKRGIDVALLYKKSMFSVLESKPIMVSVPKDTFYTRDILLVKGILGGSDTIYIFVNHWPSRRGGKDASEKWRMHAAQILRASEDSLLKLNSHAQILAMGDFNDEPTDKSIKSLGPIEDMPGGFTNLADSLKAAGDGSYHYKKEKDMIDQILVTNSFLDPRGWYCDKREYIIKFDWATGVNYKEDPPGPLHTYAGSRYIGGYSDHYPVMVSIYKKK